MHPGPSQHGIALVLVLWMLTLLIILAVGLTAVQRTETKLAGNQLSGARFRTAAEAGIHWAALNLLNPPTVFEGGPEHWVPDGRPRIWSFDGETLEIRVTNENSRIELNSAPRDLLVSLFMALEPDQDKADALADAIEDWRDANDLTELNGAEDGDYQDGGYAYGAKDGPFDSVDELQLVLGFDRELWRTLSAALTVDTDGAKVDEEFASPLVLAALRGISLEESLLDQEAAQLEDVDDRPDAPTFSRGGPLYRIEVTRFEDGRPGLSMEALVGIDAADSPPVRLIWRRFGLLSDPSSASAGQTDGPDEDSAPAGYD